MFTGQPFEKRHFKQQYANLLLFAVIPSVLCEVHVFSPESVRFPCKRWLFSGLSFWELVTELVELIMLQTEWNWCNTLLSLFHNVVSAHQYSHVRYVKDLSLSLCSLAVCLFREPLQHLSRVGPSSLNCRRWAHHHFALPSAQTQQTHNLWRVSQLRQMGDWANWHHDEAQAWWRAVWRGVWRSLEEVQPHSGCEDSKGRTEDSQHSHSLQFSGKGVQAGCLPLTLVTQLGLLVAPPFCAVGLKWSIFERV